MAGLLKRSAGDADLSSVASDVSDDDLDDDSSLFDGSSGDANTIRSGALGNVSKGGGISQPRSERSSDRKRRRGVIEKRRRDRINNSLCELRRLVPQAFEKQGNAKLEKAEILQLTVDYLRDLHHRQQKGVLFADPEALAIDYRSLGFRECMAEVARYLSLAEGLDAQDPMRLRLLTHLQCFSTSCQPSSATPPLPGQQPAQQPGHLAVQHSSTPRAMVPMGVPQGVGQWANSSECVNGQLVQPHFANSSPPVSTTALAGVAGTGSYNPATPDQSPAGPQQPGSTNYALQSNGSFHHQQIGATTTSNANTSTPTPYNSGAQNGFSANVGYSASGVQQQFSAAAASHYSSMTTASHRNPVLQQTSAGNESGNSTHRVNWVNCLAAGLAAAYDAPTILSATDNHFAASKLSENNNSSALWQQQQQHHQAMLPGIVKPEQLLF